MSGYILAVAGAVLLSAAISVILPGGKMGGFLKGMSRLAVFAVLVAPLVGIASKREFRFVSSDVGTDEGYLTACARLLSERDEENISSFLEETFSLAASATVTRSSAENFPLTKIIVNISADGIIGQDAHIDMADCIKAALAEKYGCGEQLVEIVWNG